MTTSQAAPRTEREGPAWELVAGRLARLVAAAGPPGSAEPHGLLLVGALAAADRERLRATCRSLTLERGGSVLEVPCAWTGADSFAPLRGVLEELAPAVAREAPELLALYGAELHALHPELAARLGVVPERPLALIANTPSERRSHRESERAFRMINGFAQFLHAAIDACPELATGPVLLLWTDLHGADRATLLAFRRLSRWAVHAPGRLLLVATMDPAGAPAVDDVPLPADVAGCFDWRGEHRRLLDTVRQQCLAPEMVVAGDGLSAGNGIAARLAEDGAAPVGGLEVTSAIADLRLGRLEDGAVAAVRAMGVAGFTLNFEAVLLLAGQVVAALGAGGAGFDDARFAEVWRSRPADGFAALEFASARPEGRVDALVTAWKAAGFAHACLDNHDLALDCYRRALELAPTPARRAEMCMYLALISGKRCRRYADAEAYLRRGFAEIEGRDEDRCMLERSWLLNVSALMAFQQRRHGEAMSMVQEATRLMWPLRGSEATHLKINLISNVSVLQEVTRRVDRSLKTWSLFTPFLRAGGELFAKHYHFRDAGLRLRAGRAEEALDSYQESYRHSTRLDDPFHAEIVARACGYTCFLLGRLEEAQGWYERAVELRRRVGDHERLPGSLLALAVVCAHAGQRQRALELVERAGRLAAPLAGEAAARVAECRAWLRREAEDPQGAEEARATLRQALLEVPSTKLNRPFYLINPYEASQAD